MRSASVPGARSRALYRLTAAIWARWEARLAPVSAAAWNARLSVGTAA